MATKFAVAVGVWSNTTTWNNGTLPASDDIVYSNGFTVTLDQDITVGSLRNTVGSVYLQNQVIPLMTSNILPNGVASATTNVNNAYLAFNGDPLTYWNSGVANSGTISYMFPTAKTIKRYSFLKGNYYSPKNFTFQASNDGTTWTILQTVVNDTSTARYTSGDIGNTTAYTYYRLNVTANVDNYETRMYTFEMSEEATTNVFGTANGGTYTVPNTLSGTRNITQTGDGIISNNATSVVTTNNTAGNTVNFNVSGTGLILNQFNHTANTNVSVINIAGNGVINLNGDVYSSQSTSANNNLGAIYINANATITINGNVYIGKGINNTVQNYAIHLVAGTSNSAILNINGNVIGNNNTYTSYIYFASTATINITGNLISNVSPCIVTPIATFSGGSGNINLVGTATMTNSNSQPCIITRDTLVTITGNVTNKGNTMAIWSSKIRWANTGTPYWVYQNVAGTDITLTTGSVSGIYPAEADVRSGTTYASSPTRTGTLAVPLPQYVSQGVNVGSTVGTAVLTAEDFLTAISSSSNPVATRLKNVATVQSVGEQFSVFNP